jgi:hypothetical protein
MTTSTLPATPLLIRRGGELFVTDPTARPKPRFKGSKATSSDPGSA